MSGFARFERRMRSLGFRACMTFIGDQALELAIRRSLFCIKKVCFEQEIPRPRSSRIMQ